jgi:hypothetical protein
MLKFESENGNKLKIKKHKTKRRKKSLTSLYRRLKTRSA